MKYTGPVVLTDSLPVTLLMIRDSRHCKALIYSEAKAGFKYLLAEGTEVLCREALRRYLTEHPQDRGFTTPVT